MSIVGGLDIHRKQITFDYLDTVTGQVCRGQIAPADREHVRAWLARFAGREDVAFGVEGCTGWRYSAQLGVMCSAVGGARSAWCLTVSGLRIIRVRLGRRGACRRVGTAPVLGLGQSVGPGLLPLRRGLLRGTGA
jgi:hypothetical protein